MDQLSYLSPAFSLLPEPENQFLGQIAHVLVSLRVHDCDDGGNNRIVERGVASLQVLHKLKLYTPSLVAKDTYLTVVALMNHRAYGQTGLFCHYGVTVEELGAYQVQKQLVLKELVCRVFLRRNILKHPESLELDLVSTVRL